MIRHYGFYSLTSGQLHPTSFGSTDAEAVAGNVPPGHAPIEGRYDHLSQRVDLEALKAEEDAAATAWSAKKEANRLARAAGGDPGEDPPAPPRTLAAARHVVEYQPTSPGADHDWDAATRRWQPNAAARQRRADLALAEHLERTSLGLLRKVALNPRDFSVRAELQALDEQIAGLRKES